MSAAKKREKAERREARAIQHVLSAMGVQTRRETAHLLLMRQTAAVTAELARLDWRDPDTLLRAGGVARVFLERQGVDMTDLVVVVSPGAPLALRVGFEPAIVEEARRRVRGEAAAA
jgi:hypothetical protein